jgi:hypothetical protein
MTREDVILVVEAILQRRNDRWDKELPDSFGPNDVEPIERDAIDELADAILAAEADEREKWIRLAPWWTGRALQAPEDIRRLAVAEERERCAVIADAAAQLATAGPPLTYVTAQQFAADLAKDIADGIRQGVAIPDRQPESPEKADG